MICLKVHDLWLKVHDHSGKNDNMLSTVDPIYKTIIFQRYYT